MSSIATAFDSRAADVSSPTVSNSAAVLPGGLALTEAEGDARWFCGGCAAGLESREVRFVAETRVFRAMDLQLSENYRVAFVEASSGKGMRVERQDLRNPRSAGIPGNRFPLISQFSPDCI